MDLLTRFRRRESGLVVPEDAVPAARAPESLDALPAIAPLETVDALVRARVLRDQQLSHVAAVRRNEIAAVEARIKVLRKRIWDEYREAEEQARDMKAARL